jgi:putative ABC transport system ATP-binding protein
MLNETNVIEIRDLGFRWRKDGPLILDLPKLQVRQGERVFIKGASGSGKSTLLSLIGGVLLPQRGSIVVLGEMLNKLNAAGRDTFRAEHIGFIFQMFNLIPYLSVIDNVLLPCRFSDKRERQAESRDGDMQDEAKRLLEHLDLKNEILQHPVTQLSVGQQQRVAAARALIGRPELVIADEPTSSLDADRRSGFLQLLVKECDEQDTTLIFVSHDSSLESFFDRSIHLDNINRVTS